MSATPTTATTVIFGVPETGVKCDGLKRFELSIAHPFTLVKVTLHGSRIATSIRTNGLRLRENAKTSNIEVKYNLNISHGKRLVPRHTYLITLYIETHASKPYRGKLKIITSCPIYGITHSPKSTNPEIQQQYLSPKTRHVALSAKQCRDL